ncbi:hypothetical protein VRRI112168_11955 [Vreelandella rituensis]|uniref:Uncharacterized protein n=1 Tax=Vreelandella rituensis TaxID=2282306 RepID=A0A368TX34_9GAMM|nr:hypothetical protein [Halomonas rituensis]RCV89274.1 hypothetical protein DU506_13305 [Halomonas rituensis]
MDTRESKTPEEEKQHVMNERYPQEDEVEPHLQPEAQKSPKGMHKLLPIIIVVVGILLVGLLLFSGATD